MDWYLVAVMARESLWLTFDDCIEVADCLDALGRNLAMGGALAAAHWNAVSQSIELLRFGSVPIWTPGCGRPVRRDDLVGEAV